MSKILDIGRWVAFFSRNWVNPFATLLFNFYYLPFTQAVKLPIWLYGRPRLLAMKGGIKIDGICRCGMIKLNVTQHNPYHSIPFEYENDGGTLIFKGRTRMPNGGRLQLYGRGTIVIGDNTLMPSSEISCQTRVEIGNNSWLAGGSKIFDTDFHFILDKENQTITRNSKPVIIGNNVSIYTECFIGKGVTLPDNIIVAARTNLIKVPDDCKPYYIIGGNPVRVLKRNTEKLILDWRGEKVLADKFKEISDDIIDYASFNSSSYL